MRIEHARVQRRQAILVAAKKCRTVSGMAKVMQDAFPQREVVATIEGTPQVVTVVIRAAGHERWEQCRRGESVGDAFHGAMVRLIQDHPNLLLTPRELYESKFGQAVPA